MEGWGGKLHIILERFIQELSALGILRESVFGKDKNLYRLMHCHLNHPIQPTLLITLIHSKCIEKDHRTVEYRGRGGGENDNTASLTCNDFKGRLVGELYAIF